MGLVLPRKSVENMLRDRAHEIRRTFYGSSDRLILSDPDEVFEAIRQLCLETDDWISKDYLPAEQVCQALLPAWHAALDGLHAVDAHFSNHPDPARRMNWKALREAILSLDLPSGRPVSVSEVLK